MECKDKKQNKQQIPLSLYVFVQGWLRCFINKALCHNLQLV